MTDYWQGAFTAWAGRRAHTRRNWCWLCNIIIIGEFFSVPSATIVLDLSQVLFAHSAPSSFFNAFSMSVFSCLIQCSSLSVAINFWSSFSFALLFLMNSSALHILLRSLPMHLHAFIDLLSSTFYLWLYLISLDAEKSIFWRDRIFSPGIAFALICLRCVPPQTVLVWLLLTLLRFLKSIYRTNPAMKSHCLFDYCLLGLVKRKSQQLQTHALWDERVVVKAKVTSCNKGWFWSSEQPKNMRLTFLFLVSGGCELCSQRIDWGDTSFFWGIFRRSSSTLTRTLL